MLAGTLASLCVASVLLMCCFCVLADVLARALASLIATSSGTEWWNSMPPGGGGGGGEVMGTALTRLDQVAWMLRSKQVANVLLMCC